jgi:transcriptional regulator with XRE-family HTH domain
VYGPFLAKLRTSRGMTQAQLAEVSGISQPNISAFERGRRTPTLEVLNRLVVACGYQLVADGGSSSVRFPLPRVGWFPDDDLPPALPDDPVGSPAPIAAHTSPARRGEILAELLDLADAQR